MLIIGLTGGIGSGKSTVAELFAAKHIPIIDTDKLSHELTHPGQPALKEIIQHFGETVLNDDKTLDRKKLRHIIFDQPSERKWLEQLLHPMIRKEMKDQIAQYKTPYCIVVIPLLTETTPDPIIQRILVVDTTKALQMHRTKNRDQLPAKTVSAILQSQSSRERRIQMADDVITNDGDLKDLAKQVDVLHQQYLEMSSKTSTP
ncbi:MAG: dephospho-CoA kinase [Gammaproteobacteria bacterium]|nr:dephospho-CoA kinase [Gammaproteobacteria bacterium]